MQLFGLAHETETVAYSGPGNTLTGFDQRPWCQLAARPLRPTVVHAVADEQDTARAKLVWNPGMPVGVDQFFPLNVTESPEPATAKQNDEVGQDTESSPLVSTLRLADHLAPSKVSV